MKFKFTVEQIIEEFDNSLIVLANENFEKNQRVYVKESYKELIANSQPAEIEGFVWNKAKKDEMVGVFFVSIDFLSEINQHFIDFQQDTKYLIESKSLSSLQKEALRIIISENSIFQNQLWKRLNIDSRKCSRVIKSLLDKNLIRREIATSNGARTYLLFSQR